MLLTLLRRVYRALQRERPEVPSVFVCTATCSFVVDTRVPVVFAESSSHAVFALTPRLGAYSEDD